MKNLRNIVFASIAVVGLSVPVALSAWGPDRTTYTLDEINSNKLKDTAVLNSIKDEANIDAQIAEYNAANPGAELKTWIGDETQFMNVKVNGTTTEDEYNGWKSAEPNGDDPIEAKLGEVYRVRMFVHNNNPKGTEVMANDVKAWVNMGDASASTEKVITSYIGGSNTNEVYDEVKFVSDKAFNLAYVPGSVVYVNNWTNQQSQFTGGYAPLTDNMFSSNGVQLGYDNYDATAKQFDGQIPGCYEYSGWIFFNVVAQFQTPGISITKAVATHNDITDASDKLEQTDWKEAINVKRGDVVDYLIDYRNTDTSNHLGVTILDVLPTGMSYVPLSTKFVRYNAAGEIRAEGNFTSDSNEDLLTTLGIAASTADSGFAPAKETNPHTYVVMFSAKVNEDIAVPCETEMRIVNTASVSVTKDDGNRWHNTDTADLLIAGEACPAVDPENPDKPVVTKPEESTPTTTTKPSIPAVIASTGAGLGAIVGTGAVAYSVTALNDKKNLFKNVKNIFRKRK